MGKVEQKTLLTSNWKNLSIKGVKNTKCLVKKVNYVSKVNDISLDLYNHFIKNDNNKTKALIMTLLVTHGVLEVGLRSETLSFTLDNGRKIRVKLTTKDIVDSYENIIKMVIQNYVKTRNFIVKKIINDDYADVIFNNSQNESGICFEEGIYFFSLNERAEAFGIDDIALQDDIINTIIDDYSDIITYKENYNSIKVNQNDYDLNSFEKILFKFCLNIGEKSISIMYPSDDLVIRLKEKVDEHNKGVDSLNNGISYVKKGE